jgi:hypothetical protein
LLQDRCGNGGHQSIDIEIRTPTTAGRHLCRVMAAEKVARGRNPGEGASRATQSALAAMPSRLAAAQRGANEGVTDR